MSTLSSGARQLPLRHLSIRVPWNDSSWEGVVCRNPAANTSCLALRNISERRNDAAEAAVAGKSWQELDENQLPPCVGERGRFMAPYEFTRLISHPYSKTSSSHKHFKPTPFRYPPYSAACVPFAWTLKEEAEKKVEVLELDYRPELEARARSGMGFNSAWIQTKYNQLVLLDTFFSAIQPDRSLCFFYAKRTPLVEDPKRVLIGVGWVNHVGDYVEYEYSRQGSHDSVIWERPIQHSIRPDSSDGFVLPYQRILEYLEQHPEEDPYEFVAFAPEEHFEAFSYASEHVTNDAAIAALLSFAKAVERIERAIPGPWTKIQNWISDRLNELWKMRGPYPGLGAALTAFGIQRGALLAYELEKRLADQDELDPWPLLDKLFSAPTSFPDPLQKYITPTISRKWASLGKDRKQLLKLLSRFELTPEQAISYFVTDDRRRKKLSKVFSDAEILANPYLLYELDRHMPDGIKLPTIDRGVFPDSSIRDAYPIDPPSRIDDPTDPRRVQAYLIDQLERLAAEGHTLQARTNLITRIRNLDVQPPCPIDADLLNAIEQDFDSEIVITQLANGEPAYQLQRLAKVGETVRRAVTRRLKGKRHDGAIQWRKRLDMEFGVTGAGDDEQETKAREEKAAALEELFSSRFSVLIGPAGTGKTTLLKILCREPLVENQGVLLLAPTGKARVRMETQTGIKGAQTIAQFLLKWKRYDPETGIYHLSNHEKYRGAKTIIIDEASMLTEEQLAATIDALSGVDRLILVGDPRQLPPIGPGRPFMDIVNELAPPNMESRFPRVDQGYAELTVRRRQQGEERDDLLLAEWFSGRPLDPGADEIWYRLAEDNVSKYLRVFEWDTGEQLHELLFDLLVDELHLKGRDDIRGFEISLGGEPYGDSKNVYFWSGRKPGEPGAAAKVEEWQILSPMRHHPHGAEVINRRIQTHFRSETRKRALSRFRKIPKPMGREGILYGDKVINLQNHWHEDVWPQKGALKYIANGEIGIVVGQYKTKNFKKAPWKIEVEFSSQPGYKYGYGAKYFSEDGEAFLELAYALTIHKVQGSEFGVTFLIIPNPSRMLSRELLYTALTRQQNRVILLHQGPRHELKKYASDYFSEAAQRLTNLFHEPNPVEWDTRFLEQNLIHRTIRGDAVRSKSEVVIANILYQKGVDYEYEKPLIGPDGKPRYPDFTFEDEGMGIIYFWEHLGMLNIPSYRQRWEQKLAWYREMGILPLEEGGGPNGTLIITRDDDRGGIHADKINALLDNLLG